MYVLFFVKCHGEATGKHTTILFVTLYLDGDAVAPFRGDDAVPSVVVDDVIVNRQKVRVVVRVEPCSIDKTKKQARIHQT